MLLFPKVDFTKPSNEWLAVDNFEYHHQLGIFIEFLKDYSRFAHDYAREGTRAYLRWTTYFDEYLCNTLNEIEYTPYGGPTRITAAFAQWMVNAIGASMILPADGQYTFSAEENRFLDFPNSPLSEDYVDRFGVCGWAYYQVKQPSVRMPMNLDTVALIDSATREYLLQHPDELSVGQKSMLEKSTHGRHSMVYRQLWVDRMIVDAKEVHDSLVI